MVACVRCHERTSIVGSRAIRILLSLRNCWAVRETSGGFPAPQHHPGLSGISTHKSIALAVDSDNEFRAFGIAFEFLSEESDVHVYGARSGKHSITPDIDEQLVP